VNRRPLRTGYVTTTVATLFALLAGQPAQAHVEVLPRLLVQGEVTELRIELPQLRAGAPPQRLEVEGQGLEVLASRRQAVVGVETRWTVRVRADTEPGSLPLVLRAVFADGESVVVDDAVTVVPPEAEARSAFPWVGAAVGAVLAVAFAAGALRLARRKAW
jgi:hypothetical protein